MAQYPMSRQAVTTVLDTVREHMRSEHARLMEQQTRLVRRCILLSVPFALLQLPALALAALLGGCYGLCRMGELNRRFFHGAGFLAAAVAIGGLICFAPASKGHMVLRSLEIAALVTLTVRSLSQAYGKAMPWTDRALAEKWKKQWKLFRNGLLIDVGVFVLSMPLGLPTVWALSIVAGVVLLVILAIREWMLLGRTERCCRKYLRRKIMVDSLGK